VLYDEIGESKVAIFDRRHHRLVTVIELLSPSNKSSVGFEQYVVKRNSILRTRTHLIEIDLLIDGNRLPLATALPAGNYYTYVSRGDRRLDCNVFPSAIREPLPVIPIPLLAPDADLAMNLQELFSFTYDRGRYRRSLKYSGPPQAALSQDDLQWVAGLAKA
jgi:hypothetical protein